MGGDAYLAGVIPTPGVAFITDSMGADAGIVISASHNPFYDNGIKIFKSDGYKLSDEKEAEIEQLILDDRMASICKSVATYKVAPEIFADLGADIESLFVSPDGKNINDNCGSQHTETLKKKVVKTGADIGLAFDGDGDRLIAVDEKGNVITGDRILIICAKTMKQKGILKNNLVVSTVMSNIGFRLALKEIGIGNITADVGDRHVLREMIASGAVIGGEDSGHTIFLDHHTTGDGMVLVRYSGTQPLCRVMVEGPTPDETRDCCQQIVDVVQKVLGK